MNILNPHKSPMGTGDSVIPMLKMRKQTQSLSCLS